MPASKKGKEVADNDAAGDGSDGGEGQSTALDSVLKAISRIEAQMSQHALANEARFRSLEQSAGFVAEDEAYVSGDDGEAADARALCSRSGCNRPRFREGEIVHDFCGQTCARAAGALEAAGADAEAGIDPDRVVASQPHLYAAADAAATPVERLMENHDFRRYLDELRKTDPARAALADDLLQVLQSIEVTLSEASGYNQHAVVRALAPINQQMERIVDAHVIFPAHYGGSKAHKYGHVARRAFADDDSLPNMFLGEGARTLGGERLRKEFEQCCSTLKKFALEGAKDKDKDGSPRGARGGRGGGRQQKQKPAQQPQQQQQQQQQQPAPPSRQPSQQQQQRGRSTSSRASNGGGGGSGAAGGAAPRV